MATNGMPGHGLFAGAQRLPGLLGRIGGGIGRFGNAMDRVFGGADDPRLSAQQNEQARRQAQLQAGLAMLAHQGQPGQGALSGIAQGAMMGQQAGAENRQTIYGHTATERLQQALQDPTVVGRLTPQQLAMIRLMPPDQAAKVLGDIAFAPQESKVVGAGGALVGPDGKVIYQGQQVPNLPADFDLALMSMGVDPATATAEQIQAAMPAYQELKRSGAMNVNLNPAGQQEFGNQNTLSTQFDRAISQYQEVANSYATVRATAQDPSPAGDLSLVFAYMKMLDPTSTVREGEQAQVRNAGSVPERIRAQYNRLLGSGEPLSPEQRADFLDRAKRLAEQKQTQIKPVLERYRLRAEGVGLDPSLVIYNPFDEIGLGQTPAPSPGAPTWGSK